jgi:site-specific recombinase XerD
MSAETQETSCLSEPDEASRLVAAASCMRDRLIMLLGMLCGARVAEICNLRAEHIDIARKRLLIYQGKGKKDRLLPLNAKLARMLALWLRGRKTGLLFPSKRQPGKPLTTRNVRYMIERAAARAGIARPDGRVVHPHALRRTFASQLVRKGADLAVVRDLLGHANLQTTSIYLSTDENALSEAVDLL